MPHSNLLQASQLLGHTAPFVITKYPRLVDFSSGAVNAAQQASIIAA